MVGKPDVRTQALKEMEGSSIVLINPWILFGVGNLVPGVETSTVRKDDLVCFAAIHHARHPSGSSFCVPRSVVPSENHLSQSHLVAAAQNPVHFDGRLAHDL